MYYIKLFVKGVDYIKVELICKYCGKTYLEWEERKDRSKYCSKECLKSDKHKRFPVKCMHCGKEFMIVNYKYQEYLAGKRKVFCSTQCSKDFQKPSFDLIKKTFSDAGYILLSKEYIDAKHKLEYICPKHPDKVQSILYNNLRLGNGCKYCGDEITASKRRLSLEQVETIFKRNNMTLIQGQRYQNTQQLMAYICDNHPEKGVQYMSTSNAYKNHCPYCHISKGEQRIVNFLSEKNIYYEREKTFEGLEGLGGGLLRYDFYIPDKNLLIEYQGEYHNGKVSKQTPEELEKQIHHDYLKKLYAEDNHIDLLEIWYYEKDDTEKILNSIFI